jgi:hypothetical protein
MKPIRPSNRDCGRSAKKAVLISDAAFNPLVP